MNEKSFNDEIININNGLKRSEVFRGIVKVLGSFLSKHSYVCRTRFKEDRTHVDEGSNDRDFSELEESKTAKSVTAD